jgi:hypothetical protein
VQGEQLSASQRILTPRKFVQGEQHIEQRDIEDCGAVVLKQDRHCAYKHNIDARSRNHWRCGKEINATYSECVSPALVIQHAKGMRLIIFSCATCLINGRNFGKKFIELKCVF